MDLEETFSGGRKRLEQLFFPFLLQVDLILWVELPWNGPGPKEIKYLPSEMSKWQDIFLVPVDVNGSNGWLFVPSTEEREILFYAHILYFTKSGIGLETKTMGERGFGLAANFHMALASSLSLRCRSNESSSSNTDRPLKFPPEIPLRQATYAHITFVINIIQRIFLRF